MRRVDNLFSSLITCFSDLLLLFEIITVKYSINAINNASNGCNLVNIIATILFKNNFSSCGNLTLAAIDAMTLFSKFNQSSVYNVFQARTMLLDWEFWFLEKKPQKTHFVFHL